MSTSKKVGRRNRRERDLSELVAPVSVYWVLQPQQPGDGQSIDFNIVDGITFQAVRYSSLLLANGFPTFFSDVPGVVLDDVVLNFVGDWAVLSTTWTGAPFDQPSFLRWAPSTNEVRGPNGERFAPGSAFIQSAP